MATERIHIYALSEDNSKHALSTWKALLKRMLRLVEPAHREELLDYGPVGEPEGFASYYKSQKPRDREKRITLKRAIATKLIQDGQNFVIVHLDSDKTWSVYQLAGSLNEVQFKKLLSDTDWQQVVKPEKLKKLRLGLSQRLVILLPCYSIESWLYQNTAVALELCSRHYQNRDAAKFSDWQAHPEDLDEVDKPKKQTALEGDHNEVLALSNFPARKVADVGKSFTRAIESLRQCTPLRESLSRSCGY